MKSLFQKKWFYPSVLTFSFFVLLLITLPFGSIYGSQGDWFSQHAALAEQFRQIFYDTGRIFPDYTMLGGGSNIYDISYYGFLRPDVLISFLLPAVPMTYIISVYAILELVLALNLCYIWLKRQLSTVFFAFLGTLLFIFAACLFQAHHQIMFVNYLPFLFLALFGVDLMLSAGKTGLLTISLFLFYLHSYYFSISGLFVCFLYFLYKFQRSGSTFHTKEFLMVLLKAAGSVLLSIGMAAILLVPTALDLLSTQKDAGNPTALREILTVNLSMDSLLYSSYSLGLTILCLYTLFLSIRRKSTRILGIPLLLCLTANAVPYLLSGMLYIRYKVLIPFLPLFLLLCAKSLEELYQKKIRHDIIAFLCCIVPIFFSSCGWIILIDFACMLAMFYLCHLFRKKDARPCFLLLCLFPALVSIYTNQSETYIAASDNRQSIFSKEELKALSLDENYRFDYLTEPFVNANVTPVPGMSRSTLYSSVTNSGYADFFYNKMRNPIRIRNRVALLTDANPFFSYFMGIRYIQTSKDYLPAGYEIIAQKGDTVIAENTNVLPIAYTTTEPPDTNMKTSDNNDFLATLSSLTGSTITPLPSNGIEQSLADSGICQKNGNGYSFSLKKEASASLNLETTLKQKILILYFDVSSPKGNEVTITIDGIRNKLSSKKAPYPNKNHCFTYMLSDNNPIDTLDITFSNGSYTISGIHAFIADLPHKDTKDVMPFSTTPQKGKAVLKETAALLKDGYFITSLPYRKGYQAFVDGQAVQVQSVNQGFVGFLLTAGSHEVLLFYTPPGKNLGALLSLLCFLIFIITIEKEKRKSI